MADYQSVAPTTLALTLAEAKRHLNVSSTADDAIITDHIKAATLMLEKRTHRAFVNQTRVCQADNFYDTRYIHCRRFYPPVSPLNSSGMTLSYLDGVSGAATTLPSSDYIVSTGDQPGFLAESYNATWPSVYPQPNAVTLTYIAGHSTSAANVPQHIKQAIRMVVAHWYRNREAVINTMSKEVELSVDALLESESVEGYS